MECIIREAVEGELHPDNVNRKEGFSLSKPWKSFIQTLKGHRKALCRFR
jgi:hypothetical protein